MPLTSDSTHAERKEMQHLPKPSLIPLFFLLVIFLPSHIQASQAEPQVGLYLHVIKTQTQNILPLGQSSQLQVTLQVADPSQWQNLAAETDLTWVGTEQQQVTLTVPTNSTFTSAPVSQHQSPSWVIDYDHPEVAEVVDGVWQEHTKQPTLHQVHTFTDQNIPQKNYRNGFAIASQVVKRREGDCTEHAVLGAAVARAADYAARVVLGLLLHRQQDEYVAYGHAWVEVHTEQGWQIIDPTTVAGQPTHHFYLPFAQLDNEGPGHGRTLLEFGLMRPTQISITELP